MVQRYVALMYFHRFGASVMTTPSAFLQVSSQIVNRLVDAARTVLSHYIPDVWIYTDVNFEKDGPAGVHENVTAGIGICSPPSG